MIISDEKVVYYVMSHTALDGFPLKDVEKDFMLDLIKRFAALYFTEILGFCLMGNHFHLLVKMIPENRFSVNLFNPGAQPKRLHWPCAWRWIPSKLTGRIFEKNSVCAAAQSTSSPS